MNARQDRSLRLRVRASLQLGVLACAALVASHPAAGQTYTVLHAFEAMPGRPQCSLVRGSDGNLYGTAPQGGTSDLGVVFKIDSGGTLTIPHSFSGADGSSPTAPLVLGSDGNLYGTTPTGGTGATGTVFKLDHSASLVWSTSFGPLGGGGGRGPQAGLVEGDDGNFYGMTNRGGAADKGTFFQITPGGTLTEIRPFTGSPTDGEYPTNSLVRGAVGDPDLYGTTSSGGASGHGLVFKITKGGVVTPLHSFAGGSDGNGPSASLVLASNAFFYGTTVGGGLPVNAGTVFRISAGGAFSSIHAFSPLPPESEGMFPYSELVEGPGGVLFGTTSWLGSIESAGSVYKVTFAGVLTTVHQFSPAAGEGRNTAAGLVDGQDGKFYGTTGAGGSADWGTVYSITPAGALSIVHLFDGGEGQNPDGGLVFGTNGNLYGTATIGGTDGIGTFFSVTTGGTHSLLHSFTLTGDGAGPIPGLALDSAGNFFYGTTGADKLYKVTPAGTLTTLHSFIPAEGRGVGPLMKGSDGNFYGVAQNGGTNDLGTVFQATPAGDVSPLHSFSGSDGSSPSAALAELAVGVLYGTTISDGANGLGTLFSIPMTGGLTTLLSFAAPDGGGPYSSLVLGNDGNFYGTTLNGGTGGVTFGLGSAFRVTSGTLTTIHSFPFGLSPIEGHNPAGGLIKGTDGVFYGTTSAGGPVDAGAAFSITQDGSLTTLHSFSRTDGSAARSPLVQGPDRALYGVTPSGGPKGGGVVFKLTLPTAAVVSGGGTICEGNSVNIQAALTGTPPWSLTWSDGVTQSGVLTSPVVRTVSPLSTTTYTLTAFTDAGGPGGMSGGATVTVAPIPSTPVIDAPGTVGEGSPNRTASVANHSGSTYTWSITNGTIPPGQNGAQITFTGGAEGMLTLSVFETSAAGCNSPTATQDVTVAPPGNAVLYYTVAPCRLVDSRDLGGPTGGNPLASSSLSSLVLAGCGIPSSARALALNITAVKPTGSGHLNIFPADILEPNTSLLNFNGGKTRASNGVVLLPLDGSQTVSVRNRSGGEVHLVIDVSGYFE